MRTRFEAVGTGGDGSGWWGELSMMSSEGILDFELKSSRLRLGVV